MVQVSNRKSSRGITFWVMLLAGTITCGGLMYAYGLWMRTDELLTAQVRKSLKTLFPDLKIVLAGARFDLQGRIHISDLKILLPKEELPVAECPDVILTVDREQLTDQNIVLQQIRFIQPQWTLQQYESGNWNWQLLRLPKTMGKSSPEWIVERGTIFVFLVGGVDNPDSRLIFRDISANLVPAGKRRYSVAGQTLVDRAGRLLVNGEADLETKTWDVKGEVKALRMGPDLISLATSLSPELKKNLKETLRRLPGKSEEISDLVLDTSADLAFRISRPIADGEQVYRIAADLKGGQLSHPAFPYMMSDMKGQISGNNRQLEVKGFTARSGNTQFQVSGEVSNLEGKRRGEFAVQIQQMELDERLRSLLTEQAKGLFDQVEPSGVADMKVQVVSGENGPRLDTIEVYPRECHARHQKFPYPVHGITGVGRLQNQVWDLDFKGFAGKRPVKLTGNYSSHGAADFKMTTTQMPVDDAFYQASPPQLQNVLQALNLRGMGDAVYRIFRASPQEPFQHDLEAKLKECRMSYKHFPYDLHDLRGEVLWKEGNWTFKDLVGKHGDSKLTGQGTYVVHSSKGSLLKLGIQSKNSEFDAALLRALPSYWHGTWDELSPQGRFHSNTQVAWQPGKTPLIKIEDIELVDGGMTVRSFPYRLERMNGHLSWADNVVKLNRVVGFNQETRVEFSGEGSFVPQSAWNLHLSDLIVDDLVPDRRFRKVLPTQLRSVVDDLDPRGKMISLEGELDLKGSGILDDPVTAAWNMQAVLLGSTVTVGLDVDNVHGKVSSEGTWDGHKVVSSGMLGLESATLRGYQFSKIKGPFRVNDDELIIGSAQALLPRPTSGQVPEIPQIERVRAQAIGGLFTLDGRVRLRTPFPYHILIGMNYARLEDFAMTYLAGQRDLRGLMNGYMELKGTGTSVAARRIPGVNSSQMEGHGELLIKPAALYELPVVLQVFKRIQFQPPDRSTFKEARVLFTVHNNQINLNNIALLGDSINLYGQGYVRFDHRLAMEFFARLPQNRMQIPLVQGVQGLVGAATTGVWGVSVTGTTSEPIATLRAFPRVDDAFKEFFQSLDGRPNTQPRGTRSPTTTGGADSPLRLNEAPSETQRQ